MLGGLLLMGANPLISWGFSSGLRPLDPAAGGAAAGAASCRTCHQDVYRAWAGSRHAAAATNALFVSALEKEPDPRCVNCHAPLRAQGRRDEGVNCAVCHVRDGKVRTARPMSALGEAAHKSELAPALAEPGFCAQCHEFAFRRADGSLSDDAPIQSTVTEWRAYRDRGGQKSCRDCHMAEGGHRFWGAHHRPTLDQAIAYSLSPSAAGCRLTLQNQAGHAVPTGDMTRRLDVVAVTAAGRRRVVQSLVRTFRFVPDEAGGGMRKVRDADSTLRPAERRSLDLPADAARVEVVYWFTHPRNAMTPQLRDTETRRVLFAADLEEDVPCAIP